MFSVVPGTVCELSHSRLGDVPTECCVLGSVFPPAPLRMPPFISGSSSTTGQCKHRALYMLHLDGSERFSPSRVVELSETKRCLCPSEVVMVGLGFRTVCPAHLTSTVRTRYR